MTTKYPMRKFGSGNRWHYWVRKPQTTKAKVYRVIIGKTVYDTLKNKQTKKPVQFISWKDAKGFVEKIKKSNPKIKVFATYRY